MWWLTTQILEALNPNVQLLIKAPKQEKSWPYAIKEVTNGVNSHIEYLVK